MGAIPSNWLIPAGAIVAALIAGLFSFFNLVLSKEQKLSELRQSWIDGLRDDLAILVSAMYAIEYLNRVYPKQHGDQINYVDLSKALYEPHMQSTTTLMRIYLRLNPNNKSSAHKALLSEVYKMAGLLNNAEYKNANSCIPKMQIQAQQVLKEEWERVKKGEPTFYWSKNIALVVLIATVVLGGYLAIQTRTHPNSGIEKDGMESVVKPKCDSANNRMKPTR